MYDVLSATFVCAKNGFPAALTVVDATPPPHCVEQPGVVGDTVAALVTTPDPVTTPVTDIVATSPGLRFSETSTEVATDPLVSHVPVPKTAHVTLTEPTVAGTGSETDAVPAPVPVFETVIV
jgi:hypothetical protein